MTKISANMQAVIDRLKAGDGTVVPMRGGYWLPGEVAEKMDGATEHEWFDRSLLEFGCHAGTQTVDGLRNRGLLEIVGPSHFDGRPERYSLKVHRLTHPA